jgi:hypothetical protein
MPSIGVYHVNRSVLDRRGWEQQVRSILTSNMINVIKKICTYICTAYPTM